MRTFTFNDGVDALELRTYGDGEPTFTVIDDVGPHQRQSHTVVLSKAQVAELKAALKDDKRSARAHAG